MAADYGGVAASPHRLPCQKTKPKGALLRNNFKRSFLMPNSR